MRYCKSQGGLSGGRLRSESAQKVWLLTLSVFSAINQTLEERQHPGVKDHDHADLGNSRMKDDYAKVVKLVEWFKTTDLLNTDAEKLVSFETGEVSTDGSVNCHMASEIGKESWHLMVVRLSARFHASLSVTTSQCCERSSRLTRRLYI